MTRHGISTLRLLATCFLLAGACTGAAHAVAFEEPEQEVREVFDLIRARLELMESVAAWKHVHAVAVADPAREQKVLEATVAQAAAFGIEAGSARQLFSLQIQLARKVQEHFIAGWTSSGYVHGATPD